MSAGACFHCGDALPPDGAWTVTYQGREEPVCCAGCQAVASMILGAGLSDFYRFRESLPEGPERVEDTAPEQWQVYDDESVQTELVHCHPDGSREIGLLIEGLYCAACAWLIERVLQQAPGVREVHVNPATGRSRVLWDPAATPLSRLLAELERIGYRPHPLRGAEGAEVATQERRRALRRLVVAGLGMMQVMMFAVGLYAGGYYGMDPVFQELLRWASLVVATPVVIYAGFPFFHGLWRDLKAGSPGMDVPVGLAIGAAFSASVWMTVTGGPEVYFDSVTMFTFLLLLARFVEMSARHRSSETIDALVSSAPSTAVRLDPDGERVVPTRDLRVDDEIRVREGETVPADGVVVEGGAQVSEALLSGESAPVYRGSGDSVVGGSVVAAGALRARVRAVGANTVLAGIARLLERAQSDRPRLARLADWVARRFVVVVLILAAGVFSWWLNVEPDRAFLILLAVLIATCPCALAMATPMALASGTARLARHGLLVARRDAVEGLARATSVVLDKTGTLTTGELQIEEVCPVSGMEAEQALRIAAALEAPSSHPIAAAFREAAEGLEPLEGSGIAAVQGEGIEGRVGGRRYRLGRPSYLWRSTTDEAIGDEENASWIGLADEEAVRAWFRIGDTVRDDASELVAALRQHGLAVEIASGDASGPVASVAEQLGVTRWQARMRPQEKLERIRTLQVEGQRVLMVGDGINDAPVLAGADVSAAVGSAPALAQNSADLVILGERIGTLARGITIARWTLRLMKQNLGLSAGYNFSALPLAAVGFLTPWMGALGMTLSSLAVVLNAQRGSSREEVNP